ncbi:MAG TPA: ATP-dependent DNA ligase [Candidatus Nanoarchaeia archaeon]|nr:ATP-dependent DNA ligase [Candidatus Nanoarchaeia archaeon]
MDYLELAKVYEQLEKTSKRLEKTFIVSEFLKSIPKDKVDQIILLLQGRVFPAWDETQLGVASKLVIKAISIAAGLSAESVEKKWAELGDLGLVATALLKNKSQSTLASTSLTVDKVFSNLQKLSKTEGVGSVDQKLKLIAELLSNASVLEARYVIRTVLEDLRIGIGAGVLRDAIVWAYLAPKIRYNGESQSIEVEDREAYNKLVDLVQSAYDKLNDFAMVAEVAVRGVKALEEIGVILTQPIKVMLAQKVSDADEGFEVVGKPAALEYKYDGIRVQVHKSKGKIFLFTRRLENITKQFPEVVKAVESHVSGDNFLLDCEAVSFDSKTGKYLSFQNISQRIKRKYDIEELAKKMPVELNVFDILVFEGESLLAKSFTDRRRLIEKIVKQKEKEVVWARQLVTDSAREAEVFFKESVEKGNEGVMMKNLQGIYKPGSRVGYMVKWKSIMESLDFVIVKAEWGEGKRSGWLTSFTLACMDEDGNFLEVGKVATGIKEKEEEGVSFKELTDLLQPLVVSEKGKEVVVKPQVVIEVRFEEIQKSPTYSSGYALRFPRFIRLRTDRAPEESSDLGMVQDFYDEQKKI